METRAERLAIQERERAKALASILRLRTEAFAEIEKLIAPIDASDPYVMTELEDAVDDGPCGDNELERSFGSGTNLDVDKLEADHRGGDANDEQSLGSVAVWETTSQSHWGQGATRELEDEHDGAEPEDEWDGDPDREPLLGWTEAGCAGGHSEEDGSDALDWGSLRSDWQAFDGSTTERCRVGVT